MDDALTVCFTELPPEDSLHRALASLGDLYKATNYLTWWDSRAFAAEGLADWDPADQEQSLILAAFIEGEVLPKFPNVHKGRFHEHVAAVGSIGWSAIREGLLDALKHNPTAGGKALGSLAGQFSPHPFMLLDILEDQIAAALHLENDLKLSSAGTNVLRCARLRPAKGSAFEGTLYQHLFIAWAPLSGRLLWFDLGAAT